MSPGAIEPYHVAGSRVIREQSQAVLGFVNRECELLLVLWLGTGSRRGAPVEEGRH